MKNFTKKRMFLVAEIQGEDVLYSTFILAANLKSLWHTSLMRTVLLNKSFDSVLSIKEVNVNVTDSYDTIVTFQGFKKNERRYS